MDRSGGMVLPSLAPYPPPSLKTKVMPEEWALCMESWLLLTHKFLLMSRKDFNDSSKDPSLSIFLLSYVKNTTNGEGKEATPQSINLWRQCFRLIHRLFIEADTMPSVMLDWSFLASLSIVYRQKRSLPRVLEEVWQAQQLDANVSVRQGKASLIMLLDKARLVPELDNAMTEAVALSKACHFCGQFLMVGSDMIDSICHAYHSQTLPQKKAVTLVYVLLTSLMSPKRIQTSTLLDHLFSLRSTNLMKAVIETSPFLYLFEQFLAGEETDARRAAPLMKMFASYSRPKVGMSLNSGTKIEKGKSKGKAVDEHEHDSIATGHVHKMSLISQIQDLFPDLGSGFIVKLLDEYDDDTEQVTAHLLDDDLPQKLKEADHKENIETGRTFIQDHDLVPDLAPHSTPPMLPSRHNVHDDDELDRLAVDASRLHFGRKDRDMTADQLLASERHPTHKAAILSALAAFDSDDDERDDTYDAEDVGGTVDTTFADDEADSKEDRNEETLFNAYISASGVFNRDAETRRGKARMALQSETGLTNEAIEGWAIMVRRDPKRLQRLEREHNGPQQRALAGNSWKADSGTEETEDSDVGTAGIGRRGSRGKYGGRGSQRGGSGGVTGATNEKGTQVARQRKDANKSSRANHNRRDQRARKMARGGFPG